MDGNGAYATVGDVPVTVAANHDLGTEQYGNLREQSRVTTWQVWDAYLVDDERNRSPLPNI